MAKKITELTELTTIATDDLLIVEDTSTSTTKKITVANLIPDDSISNTDLATAIKPVTLFDETTFDFVASGCVWSGDAYASTRNASMTAGVVYVDGNRVVISAVSARSFTASKDTYVDVGTDGVLDYTEVANNAASPALAANHMRIAIIVTGASNIANAGSVNQGQEDKVLPIASSIPYQVTDSLGNLICPRDPQRKIIGYRQITSSVTATTIAQATGLSATILVPTGGRKVKITAIAPSVQNGATASNTISVWDGAVSGGTQLSASTAYVATATGAVNLTHSTIETLSAGLHTINIGLAATSNTATLVSGATAPSAVLVELI